MTKRKGLFDNPTFKSLPFNKKITAFFYAVKYFVQGDPWDFALDYACSLLKGWKNIN